MGCSNTIISSMTPKFGGCDGNPVSDDTLRIWIDKAIVIENYEWAAECKQEIERRKNTSYE